MTNKDRYRWILGLTAGVALIAAAAGCHDNSVQHGESEPFSGPAQPRDQELNSTFTVFSLIVTITAKITAKKTVNFFSRHGNRVNTGFSQQGSELTVKQQ